MDPIYQIIFSLLFLCSFAVMYYLNRDYRKFFLKRTGKIARLNIDPAEVADGAELRHFILESTKGLKISGFIKNPAEIKGVIPSVVLAGGLFSGKTIMDFFDYNPVKHHSVIVTLDYPYEGEIRLKWWQIPFAVPKIITAAYNSVSSLLLVVEMLEQNEIADNNKIYSAGVSFGSFFVIAAAACTDKLRAVASLFSGGKIEKLIEANLPYKFSLFNKIIGLAAKFLIYPLEPTLYVDQISPRPFLVMGGKDDERFPIECTMALYDNAQEPKDLLWFDASHPPAEKNNLINEITEELLQWLISRDLL